MLKEGGLFYLLVHKPVPKIEDQTYCFLNDFTNILKAAFAGAAFGVKIEGIVYNLLETGAALFPAEHSEPSKVRRQTCKFEVGQLDKARNELNTLAENFNLALRTPKSCFANKRFCIRDGEVCRFKPLCDSNMNQNTRQLYQYAGKNPHYEKEELDHNLEAIFASKAPAESLV